MRFEQPLKQGANSLLVIDDQNPCVPAVERRFNFYCHGL
jgi:hypothetical protein